jgi:hypothetical protein
LGALSPLAGAVLDRSELMEVADEMGQSVRVAITTDEFVALLTESCPETVPIVTEHVDDNSGELLLHLLVADVRRFAIERFEANDTEVLSRCLDAVGARRERLEACVTGSHPDSGSSAKSLPDPTQR